MKGIDPRALEPLHEMIAEVGVKELQESTEQLILLWKTYSEWRDFWKRDKVKSKDDLWEDLRVMESYFKKIEYKGIDIIIESLKSLNQGFAAHTLVEMKCMEVDSSVSTFLEGLEEMFRMIVENPE